MISIASKIGRVIYSIIASIIVVSIIWYNAWRVTDLLGIAPGTILNKILRDLIVCIAVFIFTSLVIKPQKIIAFLGLNGNALNGLCIALLCVTPIYIGFTIFGSFNTDASFSRLLQKSILAGFKEELVFRAFMFGLLFRYAKTGFFWAVLFQAIYFGSLHLYQGYDWVSSLAAFGVTFIGAIYFSWMYVEWNFNIWVPIGLHVLMNGAWELFTMDGTEVAAGGLTSNILRLVSILLAVTITLWHKRQHDSKSLNNESERKIE